MEMRDFDKTLREIVLADYRAADVLKKFQLSFCCSQEMTLKTACTAKQIDYDLVVHDLLQATRDIRVSSQLPFHEWKIDFLADFIVNIHHAYIYQTLPALGTALNNFATGHREKYPEFTAICSLFEKMSSLLLVHNRHEDEILFPYIKQIDSAYSRKEVYGNLFVRTLRKPLHATEKEHGEIQTLTSALKSTTRNFIPPPKVCTNYQVLYLKLKEFYENLIQHMYLEHHLLFPQAIAIEQKLLHL